MAGPEDSASSEKLSLTFLGSTIIAGATIIPFFTSIQTVPLFALRLFQLTLFVLGVYWCVRGRTAKKQVLRTRRTQFFIPGGLILILIGVLVPFILPSTEQDAAEGGPSGGPTLNSNPSPSQITVNRTFGDLWQPTLDRRSVTDGGVARAVDGMELEARNCGAEATKSFRLAPLQEGDALSFDLQIIDPNEIDGAYQVRLFGAGVEESLNLTGENAKHISVQTNQAGEITVSISSLRPAPGTCRDSREFLTVQNGTIG